MMVDDRLEEYTLIEGVGMLLIRAGGMARQREAGQRR